jgi:hypothetical protein
LWDALKPLVDTLMEAGKKIADAFAPLLPVGEKLFQAFIPVVGALGDFVAAAANLLEPVLAVVGDALADLMPPLVQLIEMATQLANAIGELLTPIIQALGPVLMDVFIAELQLLLGILKPLVGFLSAVAHVISAILTPAITMILAPIKALAEFMGWLAGVKKVELQVKKPPEEKGSRDMLAPKGFGGVTSVESIWERLAQAGIKGTLGKSVEEQQLEEQKATTKAIEATTAAVKEKQAPFQK